MRRTSIKAAAFLFAGIAAGFLLYWWVFGLPTQGPPVVSPNGRTAKEQVAFVESKWAELPMTPLDGPSSGTHWAGLSAAIDGAPGLSVEMRASLFDKVSTDLGARSGTPEDYFSHAKADPTTRWIGPEDTLQWQVIDWRWEIYGHAPASDDPQMLLQEFVDDLYAVRKGRLQGFCDASDGIRVFSFTVRTPDEEAVRLEDELLRSGREERDLWMLGNHAAPVAFRVARRGLNDVLRDYKVAHVAHVMIVVETEKGERFNLWSFFVWDPKSGAWMTEFVSRKGLHGATWY